MHFIKKLADETATGNVKQAIALTHNDTDTAWFHLALSASSAVCLTRGRISFLDPERQRESPTQGQVFFYFGNNPRSFLEVFRHFGSIVRIFEGV
jgi:hypothetical protein